MGPPQYTLSRVTTREPEPDQPVDTEPQRSIRVTVLEYVFALTTVTLASGLVALLSSVVTPTDQVMIYLLGVIVVAFRVRLAPALVAALASVAAFDFLFVASRYTFNVREDRYLLTFAVMAVVGTVVSSLGTKVRAQALQAGRREQRTARLFQLNTTLDRARREAELAAEREQLRASLLASVSHDLRTPLAAIVGAVTTLEDRNEALDDATSSAARARTRSPSVCEIVAPGSRPVPRGRCSTSSTAVRRRRRVAPASASRSSAS